MTSTAQTFIGIIVTLLATHPAASAAPKSEALTYAQRLSVVAPTLKSMMAAVLSQVPEQDASGFVGALKSENLDLDAPVDLTQKSGALALAGTPIEIQQGGSQVKFKNATIKFDSSKTMAQNFAEIGKHLKPSSPANAAVLTLLSGFLARNADNLSALSPKIVLGGVTTLALYGLGSDLNESRVSGLRCNGGSEFSLSLVNGLRLTVAKKRKGAVEIRKVEDDKVIASLEGDIKKMLVPAAQETLKACARDSVQVLSMVQDVNAALGTVKP